MNKTKKCPACGRPIFHHAQVCPYCKCETHFTSVDEETPPPTAVEEEPPTPPTTEEEPAPVEAEEHKHDESHLGHYIDHLKRDKEKVKKEYNKKIKSKYSGSTILIGSVIILLSLIVLGLYIAVQSMEQKTFSLSGTVDNTMKEVLDSVESKLYQSSTIVAKFPDREKHCLYYLQDSHLRIFDAKDKSDREIDIPGLNAKAVVDYNGSGVLNAYLSSNKKHIIIIASRTSGNTEFGLYRLTTDPDNAILEFIDRGRVMPEKDGYVVRSGMRVANYDANGDKVSGISSTEYENMPKEKVDNTPKNTQEKKVEKPKLPSRESLDEQIKAAPINIDIDPPERPQRPEI
ncbi:MAG: hypothetical protein J5529_13735 [Prevotella sp.]|nr:hypothetical protein [Prevotella sp.]